MKKTFSILICITLLFLSSLDFFTIKAYSQVDTTPPELKSIQLSKQVVEAGDSIELTVEAADEGGSGIDIVHLYYSSPLTHKTKSVQMAKSSENIYKGNIRLTENDESGEWIMYYITIRDKLGNSTTIHNSKNPKVLQSWNQTDFSMHNFKLTGTQVDTTPPELKSIQLSKQVVEAGDSIELTVEAADEGGSGIDIVHLYYSSPLTHKTKSVQMAKSSENIYKGNIRLTENDESGEWIMYYITIRDKLGNSTTIHNSKNPKVLQSWNQTDFSMHNFKLTGTQVDTTPPELKSIQLSKQVVEAGDSIELTVEAADEGGSGIDIVHLYYSSPLTHKTKSVQMAKSSENIYKGNIRLTENDESGEWIMYYITIKDKLGNSTTIHNSKNPGVLQSWNQTDFSMHNFEMKEYKEKTIEDSDYIISLNNMIWSNKRIEKDLYIGPDSTITINDNVIITGNVYVYGTLISNGGLTILGTLNAKSVIYGTNSVLNRGTVSIRGGLNNIKSTQVSNQAYDIPFEIYNDNLTNESSITVLEGKTLPFLEMTVQGHPVSQAEDGTFTTEVNTLSSGNIIVNLKDVFGNNTRKYIEVKDVLPPAEVNDFSVSKRTANEIQVKWKSNMEDDIGRYALYLNNEIKAFATADQTTYTFNSLSDGTAYEFSIQALDKSDNASKLNTLKAATLLSKPIVNLITTESLAITGQAYPGTEISIFKGEVLLASGLTASDGKFNIAASKQPMGTVLNVIASNSSGVQSEKTVITVVDRTPPVKPIIIPVTDKDTLITGTAEVKSRIIVRAGENIIAEGITDDKAKFSIVIPKQKAGIKLSVTATDDSGNISEAIMITVLDVTAPSLPTVTQLTNKSIEIAGSTEPFAEVSVLKDAKIITYGKAIADGSYRLPIASQSVGTKLEVYVTDQAGNVSQKVSITVVKADPENTERISGNTRYDTAIAISQEGWKSADTVVLATGADFPDALAGGPLAYQQNAPILLTRPASLFGATEQEIERLKAKKVIILGSTTAVSQAVEDKLKDMDLTVERIGGETRFDTAKLIAARLPSAQAIVAYGLNFPDVLAISPYAAKNGIPILLTRTDRIPNETKEALKNRTSTIVVGSTDAVNAEVFKQLPKAVRYGGKTRYETAKAINLALPLGNEQAYVATGRNFPDALAGSVLAAKNNASMLLVTEKAVPAATNEILSKYQDYTIFGSNGAVGTEVEMLLNKELKRQHSIE